MSNLIRIATRKSPLALVQANRVKELIEKRLKDTTVKLVTRSTSGDTVSKAKFKKSGGKGLFLKELEELLLDGDADIAVHSLKDVPVVVDKKFIITTVDLREEAGDVLISKQFNKITELPDKSVIGTSSPRRIAQIRNKYKNIQIKEIRGNVQTRIAELSNDKVDAVILAAAGVKRLSLSDKISQYLPKDDYVPAAGQGVLCIQTTKNNEYILKTLKGLVLDEVDRCASEERDFVRQFDGDCFSPIAAHCYIKNNKSTLIGYVSSTDGNRFIKTKIVENVNEMRGIGKKLAKIMIEQGAKKILETK